MDAFKASPKSGVKISPSNAVSTSLFAHPVVWALDPFSNDFASHARTAEAIRTIAPYAPIQPVYVLNEETFENRGFTSFLKPALKSMAFKHLKEFLQADDFESIRKHASIQTPRVIVEPTASLKYAKRLNAQMIAIGTHGGHALTRYLGGSFSDVLMHENSLPVLITGPKQAQVMGQPKTVIFPTDFSAPCRDAFDHVLAIAASSGAELHLFHKNLHPLDAIVQTGVHMLGGGWVSVESYFHTLPVEHEKEGEAWLKMAEAAGVRAHLVREDDPESTADAIVQYANSLTNASPLIAMVVQAGPLSSWLLGSVTRDVIRNSPYPVYLPPRIAQA
jgi:nucleotide-binding universal stress UspA family protein